MGDKIGVIRHKSLDTLLIMSHSHYVESCEDDFIDKISTILIDNLYVCLDDVKNDVKKTLIDIHDKMIIMDSPFHSFFKTNNINDYEILIYTVISFLRKNKIDKIIKTNRY